MAAAYQLAIMAIIISGMAHAARWLANCCAGASRLPSIGVSGVYRSVAQWQRHRRRHGIAMRASWQTAAKTAIVYV
jgi:hypothetical protein